MSKFNASLVFDAGRTMTVESETVEEAVNKIYNSDEAFTTVCHQCAKELEVGDLIRVILRDEAGNEVFDDGYASLRIKSLEAERDKLKEALKALSEATNRLVFAAQCRDNTMGDPIRLIEVKAELIAAADAANVAILAAKVME